MKPGLVGGDTTQHARKAPAAERSRCSLRASPAHSLRSFAGSVPEAKPQTSESFALASLTSQGVALSGCPFQSRPGVVAGRRSRRLGGRRRAPAARRAVRSGRRARATRAREAGGAPRCAVPARPGRGWGGPRLAVAVRCCRGGGCCVVLSWRTERATAGLVNEVNESLEVAARQRSVASSPDRLPVVAA